MTGKALPADAGVPGSLLETPWAPRPEDRLGFYGCGGGIVRIGLRGQRGRKPPRTLKVDCPCGLRHLVKPTWRKPAERDEGREPDLVLDLADFVPEAVGQGFKGGF